jgi:hypothetical protein
MSIDGTCIDVADTAANEAVFQRPASNRPDAIAAYPQLRLVGLAECGTHAIVDVAIGPYSSAEQKIAPEVFASLEPGMLLMADRGFFGFSLWNQAKVTGAELLWRVKSSHILPVGERHEDGSYSSVI